MEGYAAVLHHLNRIGVDFLVQLVEELHGLDSRLVYSSLLFSGERLVHGVADTEGGKGHDMFRQGAGVGHLIEFLLCDVFAVSLQAVGNAGLNGGICLAGRDGHRRGAQGGEAGFNGRVLRDADLYALEVRQGIHGLVLQQGIAEGDGLNADGTNAGGLCYHIHKLLAHITADNGNGLILAGKQIGHIQNTSLGVVVGQGTGINDGHVHGSSLQGLTVFRLTTQLAVGIKLHVQRAAGFLLQNLLELLGHLHGAVVAGKMGAQAQNLGAAGRRISRSRTAVSVVSAAGGQRQSHHKSKEPCANFFHCSLPFINTSF